MAGGLCLHTEDIEMHLILAFSIEQALEYAADYLKSINILDAGLDNVYRINVPSSQNVVLSWISGENLLGLDKVGSIARSIDFGLTWTLQN